MSGTEISLLDRTLFDFGSIANGATGGDIFIAQNVGAAMYTQANLLVRVHARTIPGAAEVNFKAYPSAPTAEDPAVSFRGTALSHTPSAPKIVAGTAVGSLLMSSLNAPFGGHIDIALAPTYIAGGGAFSVVISVVLVLKA